MTENTPHADDTANTIIFYTFNDIMEAKIAKEKLSAKGIASFFKNENVLGLDPIGGIELKIFEKDLEEAQKIIPVK